MRRALAALFLSLALAAPAQAASVQVKGKVVTSAGAPLSGVQVRIEVTGVGPQKPATTDVGGEFESEAGLPTILGDRPAIMTFLFSKDSFRPVNVVRECRPVASTCSFPPVVLHPDSGAAALTPEEQHALKDLKSTDRNTVFLVPFHLDPAPPGKLDMPKIADSLRRAIIMRFQDLEERESLRGFTPLSPVGLRPLPPAVITPDEEADTEKLVAVGRHLNALALITGSGEVRTQGANQLADMSAGFLALPVNGDGSKLFIVEEQGVPVSLLNSVRLSNKLSPLWGHSALLAVCRREIAEARNPKDTTRLKRVRAYLIAEKSLASAGEAIKVGDIDRLVAEIDRELLK